MPRPFGWRPSGLVARRLAQLLSDRVIAAVALTSFVARLPKAMLPVTIVLFLHDVTGQFGLAGTGAMAVAIADAVSAPLQGRLLDRYGRLRVLPPIVGVLAAAAVGLTALGAHLGPIWLIGLCGLMGVGLPPISGVVRALWSALVPPGQVVTVYTLDSLLLQATVAVGPLLVAGLAATGNSRAVLAVAVGCAVGGTIGLVAVSRGAPAPTKQSPGSEDGPDRRGRHVGAMHALVGVTALEGVMIGVLPVGLSAVSVHAGAPALVGVLQSAVAVGGVIGAFNALVATTYGHYVGLHWALAATLLPLLVLGFITSPGLLAGVAVSLIAPGLLYSPVTATGFVLVDRVADLGRRTEAFSLMSSGFALGTAAGSAATGWLVDTTYLPLALGLAPAAVTAAAALAQVALRSGPTCRAEASLD